MVTAHPPLRRPLIWRVLISLLVPLLIVALRPPGMLPLREARGAPDAPLNAPWLSSVPVSAPVAGPATAQDVPALAANAGSIYAIWQDDRNGETDIYFAGSADYGSTWDNPSPVNRDIGTGNHSDPDIAVGLGGVLHAVWTGATDGVNRVTYVRSADGGATWSLPITIGDVASAGQLKPAVSSSASKVCVAWSDDRNGTYDVWLDCSADGITWGTDSRANSDTVGVRDHLDPDVAVAPGGDVHVTWADSRAGDDDIYAAFYHPATGWSANKRVNQDAAGATQNSPQVVAATDNDITIAWLDGRSGSAVYANLSLDGGISWSEGDDQVSDGAQASTPSLAFDGIDTLWAAWGSGSAAPYSVMVDRNSGAGWGVDMTANSDSEQPSGVALAASGDTAYAAWSRPKTEPDIWLSVWGGNAWDTAQQISAEGGARQVQPRLAAGSTGILYASWLDYRTSTGQPDLYVSASGDGGAHWNSGAKANGAFPVDPPTGHALAVTGGFTVHGIWSVSGDGLYYTRSSDMGASWSTPLLLVEGEITGLNLIADPFGALYLAWTDALGLMVAGSLDGGGTWSGPKLLAEAPAGGSLGRPVTAYDGAGELHVAWEQHAAGEEQGVCAAHTIQGQELWEAAICFGSGALAQTSPAVAADLGGARVAVAWAEGGGIYVAVSDEGGAAWAAPVLASGDHPGCTAPALAVQAGGDTTIAWHDPSGGSDDAYAAHLAEGGAVWSAPERINDDATSWPQRDVSLAAIGDSVYAAWADFRSADWDIYMGALPAPCQSALNSVDISGPWSVETGQNAIFSAVIDPSGATAPVRYGWAPAPSAGQYAATATYRFATTGSQQVHVQAMNCGSTVTAQRTVTVLADTTAPAWSGFSPTGWTTAKTPTVTIIAQDTGTGLDVATGLYAYSTDGGVTWSAWVSATVSGASGTTEVQTVTAAAVPFEQDSLTVHRNQIKFSVTDLVGNTAESSAYNVEIDATGPQNPTSLTGGTPSIWRNTSNESMKWSGASDASSGVAGYSYQWSEEATTVPDTTIDTTADALYATIPADGTSWYFHVRAADNAGNWAAAGTTAHIGPYWLDTVAPEAVDVTYSDPPLGNTTDTTLYVEYTGTDNPGGSGLAGFSYVWSHDPATVPSPVTNTVALTATAGPLADGVYTFHIRAVDLAGNSDKITHYGPWLVDTTQPAPPYILSTNPPVSTWSSAASVSVVWETPSDPSGIAGYSLVWDHQTSTVPDTTVDTTATSITSPLAEGEWWFHVRAVDSNGTWGFTRHSGPFRLDRTLPSFAMAALPSYVGAYTFTVSWNGADALSGLQLLTVQVRDGAGAWLGLYSGIQTALDFVGERGHTYAFRGYATDRAGNMAPWSAETSTRVGRDIIIRVINEGAQPRSAALVYRSGSHLGATNASGEITATATLIGDQFSALYLEGTMQNPVRRGENIYRVYVTSVPIVGSHGVPQLYTIADLAPSPQVLTVRRNQPLFGARLRVSVQWDASAAFLADLRQGLINASNYLYDAGDGQFFIDQVELLDAGSQWDQSDIRIGTDTEEWPHAYHLTGSGFKYGWTAIYTSRFWGSNGGRQGNWSESYGYRTLIHEFGHYILDLYDEYEDRDGDKGYGAHCAETRSSRTEEFRSSVMDYQYDATEFCSDAETSHLHYYLTEQDYQHDGESCWQTLERKNLDYSGQARWTITSPDDRGAILPGPDRLPEPAWMSITLSDSALGVCPPFVVRVLNDNGTPRVGADMDLESGGGSMDEGITDGNGDLTILGARPGDLVVLDCGVFCSAEWPVPTPCPAPAGVPGQMSELTSGATAVEIAVQQKPFEMAIGVVPLGAGQVRVEVSPTTTLLAPPLVLLQQDAATPVTLTVAMTGGRYTGTATLDPLAPPWGRVRAVATSAEAQSATSWVQFRIDSGGPDQRLELMSGNDQFEINLLAGALTQATEVGVEAGTMPAGAPGGLVPLSDAYRIRLSSGQTALAVSCQVRLRYDPDYLAQMDPTSLAIYHWDSVAGAWLFDGGTLDEGYSTVFTRTTSLGPFALFGKLTGQNRIFLPIALR